MPECQTHWIPADGEPCPDCGVVGIPPHVRTEDGTILTSGDGAFNYYDRKLGTIAGIDAAGWFDFHQTDGTVAYLNGARICTVGYAAARGWTS